MCGILFSILNWVIISPLNHASVLFIYCSVLGLGQLIYICTHDFFFCELLESLNQFLVFNLLQLESMKALVSRNDRREESWLIQHPIRVTLSHDNIPSLLQVIVLPSAMRTYHHSYRTHTLDVHVIPRVLCKHVLTNALVDVRGT